MDDAATPKPPISRKQERIRNWWKEQQVGQAEELPPEPEPSCPTCGASPTWQLRKAAVRKRLKDVPTRKKILSSIDRICNEHQGSTLEEEYVDGLIAEIGADVPRLVATLRLALPAYIAQIISEQAEATARKRI